MGKSDEQFRHSGGDSEDRESRLPRPAPNGRCFVDGGVFCPEARAGIAGKLGLSPRQMDIAYCVMAGQSEKDIHRTLRISRKTVHNHLTAIYAKLNEIGIEVHTHGELNQALRAAHAAWLRDSPPHAPPPAHCRLKSLY